MRHMWREAGFKNEGKEKCMCEGVCMVKEGVTGSHGYKVIRYVTQLQ